MCLQTVNRSFFRRDNLISSSSCDDILAIRRTRKRPLELISTDRLRLQVAITDSGREIYSWADAARIETESPTDLIGGGPFGTGPFGPFLIDIFSNPGTIVTFGDRLGAPDTPAGGNGLLGYRFRVPLAASHYQVQGTGGGHIIQYDGGFWVDPETAALKRLQARTDELPKDTGACEATTTVDFERVPIGTGVFWLPRESRLRFLYRDGSESENITTFAACHEYAGKSVLRFDMADPVGEPAQAAPDSRAPPVPAGREVLLSLQSVIDTGTAAAGDAVTAKVEKDVTGGKQRILLPAGAVVRGRLTKMEHHLGQSPYFLIGIHFESVETMGRISPFSAKLKSALTNRFGERFEGRIESRTAPRQSGVFVFRSKQQRLVAPRGFESWWVIH